MVKSNYKRWTVKDLLTLAKARRRGSTYATVQEKFFPERTVASVRSVAQTDRYKEVMQTLEEDYRIFQPDEGPGKFVFPVIGVEFDADTFASLVRTYVSDGGNRTRAETARKFGLTEEQMNHICDEYGLTKNHPAVPTELAAEMSNEELIEQALAARQERVEGQVEDRRVRYFEKKYRNLLHDHKNRETVIARVDEMLSDHVDVFGAGFVDKPFTVDERFPYVHAPLADVHLGSLAWAKEVGENYDTLIGANRVSGHGRWLATEIEQTGSYPEVIYLTDAGDFFHAILSQTESGTALDKDTRDMKVFEMAMEHKIQQIEYARRVAKNVVVMAVPGNHDHIFAELFNRGLHLHYADVDDVHVPLTYGPYTGFVAGSTAHILDHGTRASKISGWKLKGQMLTVARQAIGDGWQAADRFVYYTGHKHKLEVDTEGPMELRRLPTLGETDDYELSLRYDSKAGAEMYFLGPDGDIRRIYRFNPKEIEDAGS